MGPFLIARRREIPAVAEVFRKAEVVFIAGGDEANSSRRGGRELQ